MQNKGWSIAINTININSNGFRWESNFNISGFKTTVTELTTGSSVISRVLGQPKGNTPFSQQTQVGQAPWQYMGYIQQGVYKDYNDVANSAKPVDNSDNVLPINPTTGVWVGDAKYKDIKLDGKIDSNDLTQIGSPWPKWFGGADENSQISHGSALPCSAAFPDINIARDRSALFGGQSRQL